MDNTPPPPSAPGSTTPSAPKLSTAPRLAAAPGSPATKPTFKPASAPGAAGLPPPPSFAKPQTAAHAPSVASAGAIEMNFVDEDNKEKAPLVLLDFLALAASLAFAALLVLDLLSFSGK